MSQLAGSPSATFSLFSSCFRCCPEFPGSGIDVTSLNTVPDFRKTEFCIAAVAFLAFLPPKFSPGFSRFTLGVGSRQLCLLLLSFFRSGAGSAAE